jgi:DNA-binding HxlR family transcriptional regulator
VRWSEIGGQRCSVARTLSVVGDRWTMLVLREAFLRTRRFEDFLERTGAPRPVLADRLRGLVDDGMRWSRRSSSSAGATASARRATSTG